MFKTARAQAFVDTQIAKSHPEVVNAIQHGLLSNVSLQMFKLESSKSHRSRFCEVAETLEITDINLKQVA